MSWTLLVLRDTTLSDCSLPLPRGPAFWFRCTHTPLSSLVHVIFECRRGTPCLDSRRLCWVRRTFTSCPNKLCFLKGFGFNGTHQGTILWIGHFDNISFGTLMPHGLSLSFFAHIFIWLSSWAVSWHTDKGYISPILPSMEWSCFYCHGELRIFAAINSRIHEYPHSTPFSWRWWYSFLLSRPLKRYRVLQKPF